VQNKLKGLKKKTEKLMRTPEGKWDLIQPLKKKTDAVRKPSAGLRGLWKRKWHDCLHPKKGLKGKKKRASELG